LDDGGDGDPTPYVSIGATGLEKPNQVCATDHEQWPDLTGEDREIERLEHLARTVRQHEALKREGLLDQLFVGAQSVENARSGVRNYRRTPDRGPRIGSQQVRRVLP
jgi:hypothetical protein